MTLVKPQPVNTNYELGTLLLANDLEEKIVEVTFPLLIVESKGPEHPSYSLSNCIFAPSGLKLEGKTIFVSPTENGHINNYKFTFPEGTKQLMGGVPQELPLRERSFAFALQYSEGGRLIPLCSSGFGQRASVILHYAGLGSHSQDFPWANLEMELIDARTDGKQILEERAKILATATNFFIENSQHITKNQPS